MDQTIVQLPAPIGPATSLQELIEAEPLSGTGRNPASRDPLAFAERFEFFVR